MVISILPKWLMNYFSKDFLRQNELNILISNIFILSFFVLFKNYLLIFLSYFPHFCLFDKIIGIECPVCGITRAFCEIAKGNLQLAYNLNLSSFFVFFFLLFQIPLRLISLNNEKYIGKINSISRFFSNLILMIILINWIVNVLLKYG